MPNQVSRSIQAFTMWGRPTPQNNGCFLLKQMMREFDLLSNKGIYPTEFALTKSHLNGYIPLLGTEISRQLGFMIDSAFYGIKNDYLLELQKKNDQLKLKEVNEVIHKNLNYEKPTVVVVTKDADAFLKELKSGNCPIHYPPGVKKEKNILAEDEIISKYPLKFDDASIRTVASKEFF